MEKKEATGHLYRAVPNPQRLSQVTLDARSVSGDATYTPPASQTSGSTTTRLQYIVTPITIRILWNGQDITDKEQDAIVGERLSLQADVQGVTSADLGTPMWDIPGWIIRDWVASAWVFPPYTIEIPAYDRIVWNMNFGWVTAGESRVVEYAIYIGTPPNAIRCTAKTTFNVKRPTSSITIPASGIPQVTTEANPYGIFELTYGIPGVRPGIKLIRGITMPSGSNMEYPEGFSGTTQWVQVATMSRRRKREDNGVWEKISGTGLDGTLPYGNYPDPGDPSQTHDSPSTPLEGEPARTEVRANDTFQMWLMFKPSGSNSFWVPLRKVNWGWNATTIRTGESWDPVQGGVSTSFTPITPTQEDTTTYPTWTFKWDDAALANGWMTDPNQDP